MHSLKVALLLILTVAAMRGGSWLLGWLSYRLGHLRRRSSTALGNGLALALFVGYLTWDLLPGEPFDVEATLFGLVTFGLFHLLDLRWCPWDRAGGNAGTGSASGPGCTE